MKMKIKLNPSPAPDDLKIPILKNSRRRPCPNNIVRKELVSYCQVLPLLFPFLAMGFLVVVIPLVYYHNNFTTYKPQIRLDSLIYCPTTRPSSSSSHSNLMIWDLRFDLSNPNNHSSIRFDTFKVGIFFSNESKLLKTMAIPKVWVGPRIHGPTGAVTDAFLVDPYDLDRMMINGTVSFDLKIQVLFYYLYSPLYVSFEQFYTGDVVCRDAKVSSNSGAACGSFAADPILCDFL